MYEILPFKLKTLASALDRPLYVVGGVCRDYLSGLVRIKKDWDICAPIDVGTLVSAAEKVGFIVTGVYKNTGTVRMKCEEEDYEFTSFRTDEYVRGTHSPAKVYFTDDITLDAKRRDFKCNAVYYDISAREFADPLGGIEDIKAKRISTVAPAAKVFGEDGLRLMRLARISAQTGFTPDAECMDGARANNALICDIAAERIWTELDGILHADEKYGVAGAQYAGLKILHETGVFKKILPELALGENMEQRKDYHDYDVLEHTFRCVLYAVPQVRLAALLHDVGKPYCKINTGRFACHETEGERISKEICARLKISKKVTSRVCELVRWHMYDLSGEASVNKIRKFIVAHREILDDLLLLKQADYSACKDDLSLAPCVSKWERIYCDMVNEGVPLSLKELEIRGDDLIGAGISPDETGKTLSFLLGECAINGVKNEKSALLKYALARARQ